MSRNRSETQDTTSPGEADLERERYQLLRSLEAWLEGPMVALAFVWLALLVGELVWGERRAFLVLGTLFWGVFVLDFGGKLVLVRRRLAYLRQNWLAAISLPVPALRIFRIVRVVRLLRLARVRRGLRLFRLLSSVNRGMRARWARACSVAASPTSWRSRRWSSPRVPPGCTPSSAESTAASTATEKRCGGRRWS